MSGFRRTISLILAAVMLLGMICIESDICRCSCGI